MKEKQHSPPSWPEKLLSWFCDPDLLEDLLGDLHEIYVEKSEKVGKRKASWIYYWLTLRSLRLSTMKKHKNINSTIMLHSHFRTAFRVLSNNKFNSLLNIIGLTLGVTCFLLLSLFVKQEITYDRFHSKSDRIYRLWVKEDYGNGKIFFNSITPLIFKPVMEDHFPDVEIAVQMNRMNLMVGERDDQNREEIAVISPEIFSVFDIELLQGDRQKPFDNANSLLISENMAIKYFGRTDVIGEILPIEINAEIEPFRISGVTGNPPKNSGLGIDLAISMENSVKLFGERAHTAWFNVVVETYVLLKEGTTPQDIEAKMDGVLMTYLSEMVNEGEYKVGLQPLGDIHLNTEIPAGLVPVTNPQYVMVLGFTAILILIMACLNYTNMSIGQSLVRRREVAMRKVMGAKPNSLWFQYIIEAQIVAFISVMVAVGIAILILPFFNHLIGSDLTFEFTFENILVILAIILGVGLISGLYPALVFSNFNLLKALQGKNSSRGQFTLRKTMLGFQFLLAVFLISSTIITHKQLRFIQDQPLGYEYSSSLWVRLYREGQPESAQEMLDNTFRKSDQLSTELLKSPKIVSTGAGSHVPGTPGWLTTSYTDNEGKFHRFKFLVTNSDYLNTLQVRFLEGRNFEKDSESDKRRGIILNQAAVEHFGFEEPIGKRLPGNEFGDHEIIGVVENFKFESLHNQVSPLVIAGSFSAIAQGIHDTGGSDSITPKLLVNFDPSSIHATIELLEAAWEKVYPSQELHFQFIDENISNLYLEEQKLSKTLTVSTIIAISIAVMGLLGLTLLVIKSKLREIGIRKVNGASRSNITTWLVKSLAFPLILAAILSIPLTWWIMSGWLENFAYRMAFNGTSFIVSIMITALLSLMVIVYHSTKASLINPVNILRSE